jgi:hypothetical protein
MTQPIAVGRDVDCWCTRCKLMLAHTVESMIGSRITRVHCNTCQAQHAYRPHPPGEQSADRRSDRPAAQRAARPTPAVARAAEYATLVSGRDPASARAYATHERFAPNELIAHPSFGLGVVMTLKERTKIDVLFHDGLKTLVHSGTGAEVPSLTVVATAQ